MSCHHFHLKKQYNTKQTRKPRRRYLKLLLTTGWIVAISKCEIISKSIKTRSSWYCWRRVREFLGYHFERTRHKSRNQIQKSSTGSLTKILPGLWAEGGPRALNSTPIFSFRRQIKRCVWPRHVFPSLWSEVWGASRPFLKNQIFSAGSLIDILPGPRFIAGISLYAI